LDQDFFGNRQAGRGEVPDGANPGLDQGVGDRLGHRRRHCQDGDLDVHAAHQVAQARGFEDGLAGKFRPHFRGVGIERSDQVESELGKTRVGQQGLAQVTGSDQEDVLRVVVPHALFDGVQRRLDVVADLGTAHRSGRLEVFSYLNGVQPQGLGQGGAGHEIASRFALPLDGLVVIGEALQGRFGDDHKGQVIWAGTHGVTSGGRLGSSR